ncbi:hypothetical protein M8845_09235 [Gelidibacter japonicus]|uniref:hypothetical protein n=1 Tax=Gelidibacter japonicus TaxID=1962232 RepID=UPI00201FF1B6|nr:hypothetical protein [Gelidibacter japonicus]MCL8007606.1 hypothetical protein [Gelidibacter japonicus]
MNLEKSQLDLLSSLLQSSVNTSKDIAEISGQDKTTVSLIAVGLTLAVTGFLRSMNV